MIYRQSNDDVGNYEGPLHVSQFCEPSTNGSNRVALSGSDSASLIATFSSSLVFACYQSG